jgi:cytochrome P450
MSEKNQVKNATPPPEGGGEGREYPYPEAVQCPYAHYDHLRKDSPVHKIPGQDAHFVVRREDVLFSLENPLVFSNIGRNPESPIEAKVLKSGVEIRTMLDSDPPTQARHKQFILKHFNPKVFRESSDAIQAIIDDLIDGFADKGECDFVSQFADRLPELVICHLLDLPRDVKSKITEWGRLETSGVRFFSGDRKVLQEKVLDSLASYSRKLVEDRHQNLGNDMLSNMIRAQIERDGDFEPEYLTLTLAVLITAGLLTTALMLSNGMRLLLQHPDQMQRVIEDQSLIPNMIEEVIRIESPAQWIPKRVAKDIEIKGVTLAAGSHVCIGLAAANREEAVFPDADKFDIFRGNASTHVAFGKGTHFCMGAPLARLEGQIAFERLFSRLKNIRLAPDNDFEYIDSPSFRGLRKLNLKFDRA